MEKMEKYLNLNEAYFFIRELRSKSAFQPLQYTILSIHVIV